MKLRRSLLDKDKKEKEENKLDSELRSEVEKYGGTLIHLDNYRLQAIKNRPQYLCLVNMSYEDIEDLIEMHKKKLEEVKNVYISMNGRGAFTSLERIPEEYKDATYEDLVEIRVSYELI